MNQTEPEIYTATQYAERKSKPYRGNVGRLYESLLAMSQLKQGNTNDQQMQIRNAICQSLVER